MRRSRKCWSASRSCTASTGRAGREKAVRTTLDRLAARIGEPLWLTVEPQEQENPWRPLFPVLLRLVEARTGALVRDGFAYIPLAALPSGERGALAARMQPVLDRQHKQRQKLSEAFRAQQGSGGLDVRFGREDQSPTDARECTITAEVVLREKLQVVVGLKTPHGSWSHCVLQGSDRLEREGRELYAECGPRVPASPLDA